ncbi:MAG: FkbM family methyltransferase [Melioribacteraceae bacterium]
MEINNLLKIDFKYFVKARSSASISSYKICKNLRDYNIKTIIDIGANIGQFSLAANHFFPNAMIYSFEPLPFEFARLSKNTNRRENIKKFNLALGNQCGTIDFYKNDYSLASSVLPISKQQKEFLPVTASQKRIKVSIERLSKIFPCLDVKGPVLLKLDVQGFEKEVLLGAVEILPQIDYLLFETSFIPMYEREPLFDEMHAFVKNLGFQFIAPLNFLRREDFTILQMDVLYKRIK